MVVIEKNILPKNCILAIRSLLSDLDYELGRSQNVKKIFEREQFEGVSRNTLDPQNIHKGNEVKYARLNDFAFTISQIICERRNIKIKYMTRVMWNLYRPGDKGTFHQDGLYGENKMSILYSLNSSDGHLLVENEKFIDVENEAKIFPSYLAHMGVGPTKATYRLNCNIVFEYEAP